jgi:hypothetical protein
MISNFPVFHPSFGRHLLTVSFLSTGRVSSLLSLLNWASLLTASFLELGVIYSLLPLSHLAMFPHWFFPHNRVSYSLLPFLNWLFRHCYPSLNWPYLLCCSFLSIGLPESLRPSLNWSRFIHCVPSLDWPCLLTALNRASSIPVSIHQFVAIYSLAPFSELAMFPHGFLSSPIISSELGSPLTASFPKLGFHLHFFHPSIGADLFTPPSSELGFPCHCFLSPTWP